MNYTEQAIEKGAENGFDFLSTEHGCACGNLRAPCAESRTFCNSGAFLDPAFWRSLGKALNEDCEVSVWLILWHEFIDHLAAGETAESYFEDLLK
ncbi:MAG: hypothetical protein KGL39_14950 [Patescibacteria group bacterium]|nr:hypothetical protein [Patescibacteria group bacterium]